MIKNIIGQMLLLLCAGAIVCPPAWAQEQSQEREADNSEVEEIVVTGTRIKRRDFFTPSPLMTISEDEIEYSGQWTLEETLNQMPQVTPDYGRASNNPGNGMARVALRNMGPGRSLVLLNGRRVGASGKSGYVDINNIPQTLIERVEIITGGTSAVYGSDALAGVVNFITRQNFTGFAVDASASVTEHGDAQSYDLSLTYGHDLADGRGNITVYAGLLQREASFADSREFTKYAWQEDWEGNLEQGGSGAIPETGIYYPPLFWPEDPDADWPRTTFYADGNPRQMVFPDDYYNYAPANYLQVPLDREAFGLMGHYPLTDRYEAYLEASYTHTTPAQNLAPTPAFGWVEVNLDNPILTPAARDLFTNQFACDANLACVYMGRRFVETGPRIIDEENDYYRITAGVRGELGSNWEIDGWLSYTRATTERLQLGDVSRSRLQQALLVDPVTGNCTDPTGGCVPANIFGAGNLSPEATEFVGYPPFENPSQRVHKLASVFVSGSPLSTWAGELDVAVGLEWRSDESQWLVDEALFTGDQFGWDRTSPGGGDDSVTEAYVETVVPLASDRRWANYLSLELGARYSDYKYAGGVWTYKAGLEWRPSNAVQFRAMGQRSVRAPNSFELFEEQRSFVDMPLGWTDPCTASEDPLGQGPSFAEKCVIQGLPEDQVGVWEAVDGYPLEIINGGNPDLEPEVGQTLTVGMVLTPSWLRDWQFALDFYEIELTGAIGKIDSQEVCFDDDNTEHTFCDRITRDQTGHRVQEVSIKGNKGLLSTTGFDVQAYYRAELPDLFAIGDGSAGIDVNIIWTHLLDQKDQESPATEIQSCAGYFGGQCRTSGRSGSGSDTTFTQDRVRVSINYFSGPFSTHLGWRWIRGSDNHELLEDNYDPAVKSVPSKQYLDLGISFEFSEHLVARLGVNNILDTDPPQMADHTWDNNTDTGLYDIFGRSYYLSFSMHY